MTGEQGGDADMQHTMKAGIAIRNSISTHAHTRIHTYTRIHTHAHSHTHTVPRAR
jgi:hypothetical protein